MTILSRTSEERLYFRQNSDFNHSYALLDSSNQPLNLTPLGAEPPATVLVKVRTERSLTAPILLTFDSTAGNGTCTIPDPTTGIVLLYQPQATLENISWDNPAYYDAIITFSDGTTACIAEGEAYLTSGVTKASS